MPAVTPQPGTIGFTHSSGIQGKLIRFGEWLRFRTGSFWNHVFIVSDETDEHGEPLVIQAIAKGVNGSFPLATVAPGGSYELVVTPADVNPAKVLAFAKSQIGQEYGWISIISIALRILLPKWLPLPSMRSTATWICSALGGESLRCGGYVHSWPDVYSVVPSELYAALNGLTIKQLTTQLKTKGA